MEKFKVAVMMSLDAVVEIEAESEAGAEEQAKKDVLGMKGRLESRFPHAELVVIDISVVKS